MERAHGKERSEGLEQSLAIAIASSDGCVGLDWSDGMEPRSSRKEPGWSGQPSDRMAWILSHGMEDRTLGARSNGKHFYCS